ncbi:MAG: alpha/beta hydrolase fold domain-containing protein [Pseudomonadota bacterium]
MAAMPPLDWVNDPPDVLRRSYADTRAALAGDAPGDVRVSDIAIAGVTGLHFTPLGAGARAPILYFHGGGWVVGSPQTHVALCAWLAKLSGRVVISAAYRLAPEHRYPAQRKDARAVLAAVSDRFGRVFVAGDSAGAAMALWADAGASSAVLGVVGLYGAFGVTDSPSIRAFGPASDGLQRADIVSFYKRLGLEDASVIRADFGASGAPVLLIKAAEDSLADDADILAAHLTERQIDIWTAPGQPHAFLQQVGRNAAARYWMARVASWINARDADR